MSQLFRSSIRRSASLAVGSALLLAACGQAPSPVVPSGPAATVQEAEAANPGPATALKILGTAKFKDGGAGLRYIAVRGGKEVDRTLEVHPDKSGKWQATLNGHVVTKQYFQGREGRLLMSELQVIAKVKPEQTHRSDRSVQALPAIVVGATVVYIADLMVRASLVVVGNVFIDIINALVTAGRVNEDLVVNWKILLPFNWGYANGVEYVQR